MMARARIDHAARLASVLAVMLALPACERKTEAPAAVPAAAPAAAQPPAQAAPQSLQMGGKKSVTTFFVTSRGPGKGGDLGGLTGADAHCQALANKEGSGDHTWRAYLSTSATGNQPAVNARDRIGKGPWYNAEGLIVAANVEDLHTGGKINKDVAVTERLDQIPGDGDTPNKHDILTGSRPDGTAFDAAGDLTCRNWTSSSAGKAQVGHHDRRVKNSWNSAHASDGCSQKALEATGGAGLIYCFGID
jgi:hypothetical protein